MLFNDREVAEKLKVLFGREEVLGALDAKVAGLELEVGDSGSSDELDDTCESLRRRASPARTDRRV